eukprot:3019746-Lingulodinium_polyedra.AAC.1
MVRAWCAYGLCRRAFACRRVAKTTAAVRSGRQQLRSVAVTCGMRRCAKCMTARTARAVRAPSK